MIPYNYRAFFGLKLRNHLSKTLHRLFFEEDGVGENSHLPLESASSILFLLQNYALNSKPIRHNPEYGYCCRYIPAE